MIRTIPVMVPGYAWDAINQLTGINPCSMLDKARISIHDPAALASFIGGDKRSLAFGSLAFLTVTDVPVPDLSVLQGTVTYVTRKTNNGSTIIYTTGDLRQWLAFFHIAAATDALCPIAASLFDFFNQSIIRRELEDVKAQITRRR